jgi:hypothetical protein
LLIKNKFEVKTQFECQITYKSNLMLLTLRNSNGDVSNWSIIFDKMFKIRLNFYYIIYKWWHEILTNLIILYFYGCNIQIFVNVIFNIRWSFTLCSKTWMSFLQLFFLFKLLLKFYACPFKLLNYS